MNTRLRCSLLLGLGLSFLAVPALAGDPVVRPGKWNKKIPKGWVVVETKNYQIQTELDEQIAEALGEHLEAMLDVYRDMLPFHKRMPTFVLKVFKNREHFLDYYPSGKTAAAYYDKRNKELVGYDTGTILGEQRDATRIALASDYDGHLNDAQRERLDELFDEIARAYTYDLADVLSHEGWHQYFHYYTVSWVPMPSWLDEGLGDYFFTAEKSEHDDYTLGLINHNRLRVIRQAFVEGTSVTFGEMLDFVQKDYYSNASVFYAQGWSMVYFLMQSEEKKRRALIPKLIKHFKNSKNFQESTERTFKKIDLDELDSEWIGWVLGQIPYDPLLTLAEEFGTRIVPSQLAGPSRWVETYERHWKALEGEPSD
jgi:hypothetical protein